ncbi:MAG: hypothetical protein ACREJE_13510, partial [Candidatus Rokuibacteriota bacterium]
SLERYEPLLAGRSERVLSSLPPSYLLSTPMEDMADEVKLLLAAPGRVLSRLDLADEHSRSVVTVASPGVPETLALIAGVLALHRIDVLAARSYATAGGPALTRVIVAAPEEATRPRIEGDLVAAFTGSLAVDAALAAKIKDYREPRIEPEIRVLDDASDSSTVIEVRAPDALGLLYALTAGFADLGLAIHVAKIDTLGHRVVDVFYVRTLRGAKLGAEQSDEVRRAIRHRVDRLLNG